MGKQGTVYIYKGGQLSLSATGVANHVIGWNLENFVFHVESLQYEKWIPNNCKFQTLILKFKP